MLFLTNIYIVSGISLDHKNIIKQNQIQIQFTPYTISASLRESLYENVRLTFQIFNYFYISVENIGSNSPNYSNQFIEIILLNYQFGLSKQ